MISKRSKMPKKNQRNQKNKWNIILLKKVSILRIIMMKAQMKMINLAIMKIERKKKNRN